MTHPNIVEYLQQNNEKQAVLILLDVEKAFDKLVICV